MFRTPRRAALVVVIVLALLLAVLIAAFAYTGGWACLSQTELERTRTPKDVVGAFADDGVELVPMALPPAAARNDKAYRDAAAYRHVNGRAALFVIVCKVRCRQAPHGIREQPIDRQHVRQISVLGNNIVILMTDSDRRSGRDLQERVQAILNELDAAEDYNSRCYSQ